MTDQETHMPFDRLLCARVGMVLLEIALGKITPRLISCGPTGKPHTCWDDTCWDNPVFRCGHWQLAVFNDGGDWDYIDGGKTPVGVIFDYDSVYSCDSEDNYFAPEASLTTRKERDAMIAAFKKARRD